MDARRTIAAGTAACLLALGACAAGSPTLAESELTAPVIPHAPPTDTAGFVPANPPPG